MRVKPGRKIRDHASSQPGMAADVEGRDGRYQEPIKEERLGKKI